MTKPALWMGTALLLASCAESHTRPPMEVGESVDAGVPTDVRVGFDAGPACSSETCDGRDDDCDGVVDEEVTCSLAGASSSCAGARCVLTACMVGFADCDDESANGCEVATSTDRANCGACGVECGLTEACNAGICVRERILDVATGSWLSSVLLESGRVLCWGLVDRLDHDGTDPTGRPFPVSSATPFEIEGMPAGIVRIVGTKAAVLGVTAAGEVWVSVARLPSLHPTSGVLGHTVLMGLAAPWYAQSAYWSAGRRDGQVAELGG